MSLWATLFSLFIVLVRKSSSISLIATRFGSVIVRILVRSQRLELLAANIMRPAVPVDMLITKPQPLLIRVYLTEVFTGITRPVHESVGYFDWVSHDPDFLS